jgi:hypothetical protein
MTADRDLIVQRAYQVFRADVDRTPSITLRGGDTLDRYNQPPPDDADIDAPTDAYLEVYAFHGMNFIDAPSWRHYLPRLIDYALRNIGSNAPGTMAIDGLLWSLRPPDSLYRPPSEQREA